MAVADCTIGHISPEELMEMRKRMEATLSLVVKNQFVDFQRYLEANKAFHEYVMSLARNKTLLETYRRLGIEDMLVRIVHHLSNTSFDANEAVVSDHQRLVEAYEREDRAYAKAVIAGHTERAKQAYLRAMAQPNSQIQVNR
jgi:DNA-binding GntR family transcriptional regulator